MKGVFLRQTILNSDFSSQAKRTRISIKKYGLPKPNRFLLVIIGKVNSNGISLNSDNYVYEKDTCFYSRGCVDSGGIRI